MSRIETMNPSTNTNQNNNKFVGGTFPLKPVHYGALPICIYINEDSIAKWKIGDSPIQPYVEGNEWDLGVGEFEEDVYDLKNTFAANKIVCIAHVTNKAQVAEFTLDGLTFKNIIPFIKNTGQPFYFIYNGHPEEADVLQVEMSGVYNKAKKQYLEFETISEQDYNLLSNKDMKTLYIIPET